MAEAIFWLLMIYLLVAAGIALRAVVRGPKGPGRIAFGIAALLVAFPWVRSWFSTDGQGTFHPTNAIAQFEWLLVGLALVPIQLVCLFVILTNRKAVTNG
jgi:hypothetical protein